MTFRLTMLAVMMAAMGLGTSYAANEPYLAPVKEISPEPGFVNTIRPFVSRLENVRFFEAGPSLIGIAATNPAAKGNAPKGVVMFFDKSGQTLIAGQVLDWQRARNYTALASQQFLSATDLGKLGTEALKEQKENINRTVDALKQEQTSRVSAGNRYAESQVRTEALAQLPFIEAGSGKRLLYAVVDLGCPHCKRAILELTQHLQGAGAGKGRIRWILTANPKDATNSNLSAMVLAASDRLNALQQAAQGQMKVDFAKVRQGTAKLDAIQIFVAGNQIKTLPFFVFVEADGLRFQTGYSSVEGMLK